MASTAHLHLATAETSQRLFGAGDTGAVVPATSCGGNLTLGSDQNGPPVAVALPALVAGRPGDPLLAPAKSTIEGCAQLHGGEASARGRAEPR